MKISEKDWNNYIKKLQRLDDKAASLMQAYIDKYGTENRQALIDYAYAVATKYGEGSATLTAQMYDAIAEVSGLTLPSAEVAETPTYKDMAITVNGTLKKTDNAGVLSRAVGAMVKRTGADTMLNNSIRDGVEVAWIPVGDTCAYCLTLASKGWQKASKELVKNGHAEHIHANCNCNYAVRFNNKTSYASYDPSKYQKMYADAEGKTAQDKINYLRRLQYEERKEDAGKPNAQN